jgi:hypothetical protein
MTGVAAQMCANPPADLLEQFPELKERVGPRHAILNDLSPAACHIAYNYNTPVDADALQHEFERIKAAVKDEFDWLYGTEHYEPAVDVYDPANADVASRLKNPPSSGSMHTLLGSEERTWELLAKTEVEARLGYPVPELPPDKNWGNLDVAKVKQWVCIPATIQYTIPKNRRLPRSPRSPCPRPSRLLMPLWKPTLCTTSCRTTRLAMPYIWR